MAVSGRQEERKGWRVNEEIKMRGREQPLEGEGGRREGRGWGGEREGCTRREGGRTRGGKRIYEARERERKGCTGGR